MVNVQHSYILSSLSWHEIRLRNDRVNGVSSVETSKRQRGEVENHFESLTLRLFARRSELATFNSQLAEMTFTRETRAEPKDAS